MKKRSLASLLTHQYKKLPVTMKKWMQFNIMPWTSLGVDAVQRHAQDDLFQMNKSQYQFTVISTQFI